MRLYGWMGGLRTEYKAKRLAKPKIQLLNSLNFVWHHKEAKWFSNYFTLLKLGKSKKPLHSVKNHESLLNWYNNQLNNSSKQVKKPEFSKLFTKLRLLITEKKLEDASAQRSKWDMQWLMRFEELKEYRKRNPNRWPDERDNDLQSRKIGIWLMGMRARIQKDDRYEEWRKRLEEIGVSFFTKQEKWMNQYKALLEYIKQSKNYPHHTHLLYSWYTVQKRSYHLRSAEQIRLLKSLPPYSRLVKENWEEGFARFESFYKKHHRLPLITDDRKSYSWILWQRSRSKKGLLLPERQQRLAQLIGKFSHRSEPRRAWEWQYRRLIEWRMNHPEQWPSYYSSGIEKKLTVWSMAQRQKYAGTLRPGTPLTPDQILKLNQINFPWKLAKHPQGRENLYWEKRYAELKSFIENHSVKELTTVGRTKPLYFWLHREKIHFRKAKLNKERTKKLLNLGIALKKKSNS